MKIVSSLSLSLSLSLRPPCGNHEKEVYIPRVNEIPRYRSLLASRSDSSKVKRSPSRTGPFTFLIICRFCSPRNSTFTWVHCPCEPVRPRTLMTRAKTTGLSILISLLSRGSRLGRGIRRKWKKTCRRVC